LTLSIKDQRVDRGGAMAAGIEADNERPIGILSAGIRSPATKPKERT
jgi:hypothetical protein